MLRLRELRLRKNISQEKLAREIGVSRSTIAMWETGKSQPDNESLKTLAKYFDVSIDFLLGNETDYLTLHQYECNISPKYITANCLSLFFTFIQGDDKLSLSQLETLTDIPYNRLQEIIHSLSKAEDELTPTEIKKLSLAFGIQENMMKGLFITKDFFEQSFARISSLNNSGKNKVKEYINDLKKIPSYSNNTPSQAIIADDIKAEIDNDLKNIQQTI